MIKIIPNFPDNVLALSAEGEITGTDYETILIPALEAKLKINKKISVLYHISSNFIGFDLSAMFDDAKFGIKHLSSFERIAFVSDHPKINSLVKFFSHIIPSEVRIFKDAELEEAKKWISAL